MQERVKPTIKVTLDVDAAVVAAARANGYDLALIIEQAVRARIDASKAGPLSDADREAIEAHNRYIAEHGTLAESLRDLP